MNICNELRVSLFLQARVISSFHFISPFSSFFLLRGSGAPEPFLFVPEKGSRKDCPSPISPAQTSAPAGDAPLGAIPCPKAPLCKGSWLPLGRLRSCSSKRPRSGLPAWWGRYPLGVPFERAKGTKTRLGRSPLRTSLGVPGWNCVNPMVGPGPGGVTWVAWQVYGKRPLLCEMVPLLPGPHPGEAAFPPPGARLSLAGNSGSPG